jgi:hypothetical protein
MNKKLVIVMAAIIMAAGVMAQTDPSIKKDTIWRKGGYFNVNFNQASFSNWAAGGINSYGGSALLTLYAKMKSGKWAWDNNLDLAFGGAKTGNEIIKKTDDKIDFNSKVGWDMGKNFYLTYLLGFKTQFTEGFNYTDTSRTRTSAWLTPAYLLNSIGIDWKPYNNLTIFLSPITARTTMVENGTLINEYLLVNQSLFGVPPGTRIHNEMGAYFKAKYGLKIMENIRLNSEVDLFSNYEKNPQNVKVNWDEVLEMKVNKYINVLIQTNLIYDDEIQILRPNGDYGPGVQFKEAFGLGLAYRFQGFSVK